jgi:hypothetical protein
MGNPRPAMHNTTFRPKVQLRFQVSEGSNAGIARRDHSLIATEYFEALKR